MRFGQHLRLGREKPLLELQRLAEVVDGVEVSVRGYQSCHHELTIPARIPLVLQRYLGQEVVGVGQPLLDVPNIDLVAFSLLSEPLLKQYASQVQDLKGNGELIVFRFVPLVFTNILPWC